MGGALIAECNFLLNWAKESGYSPLGLSGVSMGGYMASLAYTNSSGPVSLVPCLSSSTAAPVFVKVSSFLLLTYLAYNIIIKQF